MPKLTLKQQKFINKYLETGNATEAASKTYNTNSRGTAQSIGTENLSKPVIEKVIQEKFHKEEMDENWVLKGFKKHAEQSKDRSVSLRAYELTAKYLKMLTDRVETKDSTIEKLPSTPEERKKKIAILLERLHSNGLIDELQKKINK